MKKLSVKNMLPEYPMTRHLPWKPNTRGDRIADEADAAVIFQSDHVSVQEKIDAANCGMVISDDGHPTIRNRTKILRKGDLSKELNPSLSQFAAAFTWFYKNKEKFEKIRELLGPVSVYGEWMTQQHGMVYDNLPDWFIAYDVYDWEARDYLDPSVAIANLTAAGFATIPVLYTGKIANYEQLEELANGLTPYANGQQREGVYVKVSDGKRVTDRFKMVRQGFQQGCLLGDEIKKNKVR